MGGLFSRRQDPDNELTPKYNINEITKLLHMTRYNLDLCLFVISDSKIVDEIIRLHFKSVRIRLILDQQFAITHERYARRLRRVGVAYRWKPKNKYAHHKMLLIDAVTDEKACHYGITPTAVTGVYEVTKAKMATNLKNVEINNSMNIVRVFKEEFDQLWDELDC